MQHATYNTQYTHIQYTIYKEHTTLNSHIHLQIYTSKDPIHYQLPLNYHFFFAGCADSSLCFNCDLIVWLMCLMLLI